MRTACSRGERGQSMSHGSSMRSDDVVLSLTICHPLVIVESRDGLRQSPLKRAIALCFVPSS